MSLHILLDYLDSGQGNVTVLYDARDGIRFTSGYLPAPICTSTRRSALCGQTRALKLGFVPIDVARAGLQAERKQ